jgi:hypothetical protein
VTVIAEQPKVWSEQRESKLQGKTILLSGNPPYRPSSQEMMWHNENKYRG